MVLGTAANRSPTLACPLIIHPWPRPVRFAPSGPEIGRADFRGIRAEIHDVAVGPEHARVIEPGHFCLNCWM
jgi:hypothetical protein